MRRRDLPLAAAGAAALAWALFSGQGCSAGESGQSEFGGGNTTSSGTGGSGNGTSSGTGGNGTGGVIISTGGNGTGGNGTGGITVDPCNSECGPVELCDGGSIALDDDCDGVVDEDCDCGAGAVQACFKGDPSFVNDDGCFPGSQKCTELGTWGECLGGVHGTDNCAVISTGCHAISSAPFVTVNLKQGTGTFSDDAVTESWEVTCPAGVSPCPAVSGANPADDFQPLQSGEYSVTYSKTTANGDDSCTYPLFVGAPGLRVELQWEWDDALGSSTVDLDLHVHKPGDTTPWGGDGGNAVDCAWDNCTADDCGFGICPTWFNGVAPPDPMNWYLDPVFENNTCYFGPKGNGLDWQSYGQGCHNPRLDIDNISCDPTVTDPQDLQFCNPENINIDFPPMNKWTRIGVHYYSAHGVTYNVHPVVKVFCHGQLAAELGNQGYYNPEAPVTFVPADGASPSTNVFWLVADVLFKNDECDDTLCVVEPIYFDPTTKLPVVTTVPVVLGTVGPDYPPIP